MLGMRLKSLGKIIHPLFWFTFSCMSDAAGTVARHYEGVGEVVLSHITYEQAKIEARKIAYAEIISKASGVLVQNATLMVNSSLGSYTVTQTSNARVVDGKCDYELESEHGSNTSPIVKAKCKGKVQEFGENGPIIESWVYYANSNGECDQNAERSGGIDTPIFRANEKFCIWVRSSQSVWIGVYGIFQYKNDVMISRVFPSGGEASLNLRANVPAELEPISSVPLAGLSESHEALIILASVRPEMTGSVINESGETLEKTLSNSVEISEFDTLLGRMDLRYLTINTIPYLVTE